MQDLSKEVEQALDLLDAVYKRPPKKPKLILDKGRTVYLQVVLFKIPYGAPRKRKFLRLRHSLYGNEPEICLFVPNRKTGVEYKKTTEELIDFCVDYYTELLEKHKIKGITTVMPLKQLKSEYGTYELRRKLVHRFDLFLCKNSLLYNSRFLTSLGKAFRVTNKDPLGISFPKEDVDYDPDFQKNIERAIFTSSFYINRFSDNYSIPLGSLSHTRAELKENLEAVLGQISKENVIPGGFRNIRAMYLWPSQSKPVPLYMSSELPVGMKKPTVKSKRKRPRGVEGELSTQPHKKVFVTPSGEVFVTKLDKDSAEPELDESEDDGEDSFKEESDDDGFDDAKNGDVDGDDGVGVGKKAGPKTKGTAAGGEEDSESEDDEEIEEKEARMMEIKRRTESDSEDEENGKESKIRKDSKPNKRKKTKDLEEVSEENTDEEEGEESDTPKRIKSGKTKQKGGGKIKKNQRKMLIKQKKFKSNEGADGKKKKKFNNKGKKIR